MSEQVPKEYTPRENEVGSSEPIRNEDYAKNSQELEEFFANLNQDGKKEGIPEQPPQSDEPTTHAELSDEDRQKGAEHARRILDQLNK